MNSLGFSMYHIISSASRNSLVLFPVWTPYISFSYLITLSTTPSAMLDRNGQSLVPDLSRKESSLSP